MRFGLLRWFVNQAVAKWPGAVIPVDLGDDELDLSVGSEELVFVALGARRENEQGFVHMWCPAKAVDASPYMFDAEPT